MQSSKKTTKNDKAPASEQGGGEDVKSKGIVNGVIVYECSLPLLHMFTH